MFNIKISGIGVTLAYRLVKKIIFLLLKYTIKMDIILPNPDNKVDLLKIEEYKPKFNTSDEVKTLLNEIIGTELEIPAMIDCFYGFRMSEVIWLK